MRMIILNKNNNSIIKTSWAGQEQKEQEEKKANVDASNRKEITTEDLKIVVGTSVYFKKNFIIVVNMHFI